MPVDLLAPTVQRARWGFPRPAAIWRRARWGAVAVLLPAVFAIQAAIVVVLCVPFDRADLDDGAAPLTLLDLRGQEIVTLPAMGADRTRWTELGSIPTIAISAVVESEDERFYEHRGVDGLGVLRAVWLDLQGGRYGASTLTMQLARMLTAKTNTRTVGAKVTETLLALRMERAVDKRTILEQWMNRAYFGNGAYGFDAAARLYFGRPATALSNGEAVLLAVIPRAPTGYDPLAHLPATLRRRDYVLDLLVKRGAITAETAFAAKATPIAVARHAPTNQAPHFTQYVVDELPPGVRQAGGVVHTSLDLELQRVLQRRVSEQIAALAHKNLDQAGLVVIDAQTLQVRAMVGSIGWDSAGGQINITTRRRHPGSALKPFVYATAIERGANPATIAWDIRETNPDFYSPHAPEHGPSRYREALGSSYNFAAVDVLADVGIARVLTLLREAGVGALPGTPDDYGLRLALGAAKVRLVDLTGAYGAFVNGGMVRAPTGIEYGVTSLGDRFTSRRSPAKRIFSAQTAWLVNDMLADPEARRPGFGMELPLDLPFPVAAKTGTARGFTDTWAIGATKEAIVGTWAGTFDGTPTQGIVGMDAAAPLLRDAMLAIAGGVPLTLPARPDGIDDIEVCSISGMRAGEHCPRVRDHATHGRAPTDSCTWHDATGITHYPERAKGWLQRRRFRAVPARPGQ